MEQQTHTDPAWQQALDTHIAADIDGITDTWAAACIGARVRQEALAKLASDLALNRPLNATPAVAVPELLVLLLTETPDVAMRARALLRERLLVEHSEAVAALVWRDQDARDDAGVDICDAYKRWRDRDLDVGSEFDRSAA